ncbi:MAG: HEAT repeat domain-containing protein [Geminicoccaceae bacterium]
MVPQAAGRDLIRGSSVQRYQAIAKLGKAERLAEIRDLATARDELSANTLVEVLILDSDVTARRIAVTALGNLRSELAVDGLEAALGDRDRSVRIQALRGLRMVLAKNATSILAEVVASDPDPVVRRTAVELAAGLRSSAAREVLELGSLDVDPSVRDAVNAGRRRR